MFPFFHVVKFERIAFSVLPECNSSTLAKSVITSSLIGAHFILADCRVVWSKVDAATSAKEEVWKDKLAKSAAKSKDRLAPRGLLKNTILADRR